MSQRVRACLRASYARAGRAGRPVCVAASSDSVRASSSRVGYVVAVSLPPASTITVTLSPGWGEDVTALLSPPGAADAGAATSSSSSASGATTAGVDVDADAEAETVVVSLCAAAAAASPAGGALRVELPQRSDCVVHAGAGDVLVAGKLEGALEVESAGGAVTAAGTLRGAAVSLSGGALRLRKAVEATAVALVARGPGGVRAGRLLGDAVTAVATAGGADVHVDACYAARAAFSSTGGAGGRVRVDGHHGAVDARTADGDVRLGGVTGAARVVAGGAGRADVVFDSARGASVVRAGGDVTLRFVPPVPPTRLRLAAPRGVLLRPGLTGVFRPDAPPVGAAAGGRARGEIDDAREGAFDVAGVLRVGAPVPASLGGAEHGGLPLRRAFAAAPDAPPGGGDAAGARAILGATLGGEGVRTFASGGGPQPPRGGAASGGSGKVSLDVAVTGFYEAAGGGGGPRADGGAPDAPAGDEPSVEAVSETGAVIVEVVTWADAAAARASAPW